MTAQEKLKRDFSAKISEVRDLHERIRDANRKYHVEDNPDISDAEYDALVQMTRKAQDELQQFVERAAK